MSAARTENLVFVSRNHMIRKKGILLQNSNNLSFLNTGNKWNLLAKFANSFDVYPMPARGRLGAAAAMEPRCPLGAGFRKVEAGSRGPSGLPTREPEPV